MFASSDLPFWLISLLWALSIGPYGAAIVLGKPSWIRPTAWAHVAVVFLILLRNLIWPVPLVANAMVVMVPLWLTIIAVIAGISFWLARRSQALFWAHRQEGSA